jgi:phenylpropionate dioxygenase-like ring-hydroxylating dioxygenase large terminal subunit
VSDFVPVSALAKKQPPSFQDAPSLRHKAWAAGFDPAYWYPVEFDRNLPRGAVREVRFQGQSIALFRGEDGELGAVEDRCAHRHVKLSTGKVKDCRLTCRYHGWAYGKDGKLEHIQHQLFGKPFPSVELRSFPVAVRYGIVFVFFGDPSLMAERPLPTIPALEGPRRFITIPIDFTVRCHPTAYVNNIMDSTHVASLHRKFRTRSLIYGEVTRCEAEGDHVVVSHSIELDEGGLLKYMVPALKTPVQDAHYQYPYLWVSVGGVYQLWNFMLPIDARTTRLFLLSCADRVNIPFTPFTPPDALIDPFLRVAKELVVRPLFEEDVWSVEAEQAGYDAHFDTPAVDPHPAIRPSYQLTVRKWEECLAREASRPQRGREPKRAARQG